MPSEVVLTQSPVENKKIHQINLDTPLSHFKFIQCAFENTIFTVPMLNVTFENCELTNVRFDKLKRVKFQSCVCRKMQFMVYPALDVTFVKSTIEDSEITHSWKRLKISDSVLRRNTFDFGRFDDAEIECTSAHQCTWRDAVFRHTHLRGVRVGESKWTRSTWHACKISGHIAHTCMRDSTFSYCDLRSLTLVRVFFTRARMFNSIICASEFRQSTLAGSHLLHCSVHNSRFDAVVLDGFHMRDTQFADCQLRGCDFIRGVATQCTLDNTVETDCSWEDTQCINVSRCASYALAQGRCYGGPQPISIKLECFVDNKSTGEVVVAGDGTFEADRRTDALVVVFPSTWLPFSARSANDGDILSHIVLAGNRFNRAQGMQLGPSYYRRSVVLRRSVSV